MALSQPQAFPNQIPFGVPNQMPSMVPPNAQGLALPWGKATFNISRTASSDPVQNIVNDIGNPMGGMSVNFGMQPMAPAAPAAPNPALKPAMLTAAPQPMLEDPYSTRGLAEGYRPPMFGLRNRMLGFT